ncbi:MAG: AAA family ATPase [Candidatus Eisenbacteria bacterium]|nr:AAA family ATPase [Candidatus Eisenbacteria bacterium]
MTFQRPIFDRIVARLSETRRFMQVLAGPRQSGKTTLARQVIGSIAMPSHYATADEPSLKARGWIETQWETARQLALQVSEGEGALLVLDEAQKVAGWSESVKRLWDEDTRRRHPLHVLLLGSAPLRIQSGLTESLAGRFELIPVTHWSFSEMRGAFGWGLEQYILFGGYPGSAGLIDDPERWSRYILDSLIETTVARDILLMTRVDKPALLRELFQLGCDYSGQILSYTKMLGQLHDAGNTTTLAHYLRLLSSSGMLAGLSKFSGKSVRRRASSPKLLALNTALMTASYPGTQREARADAPLWGRLVETTVGAHLVNGSAGTKLEVFYWREGNQEVDYVIRHGRRLLAIEVKSGRLRSGVHGLDTFQKKFPTAKGLIVGKDGIALENFLESPVERWMGED